MNIRHYTYQILIGFLLCSSFIAAKNFIFDLGGVLVDTDKFASLKYMGPLNLMQYSIQLRMNPLHASDALKSTLFATLEKTADLHELATKNPLYNAYDKNGDVLPYLMRAWLLGSMNCATIHTLLADAITYHSEWFNNAAEQRIIKNLCSMIFTPHDFVTALKISSAGIAFIKKCKKNGHKIYALSNWDKESFALLKAKHANLFDLFDGIVISGESNELKPHPRIYQVLLEQFQLDPHDCWFIDDQQENVLAAQAIGINAVVHPACFKKLAHNIQQEIYSKSVTRRENFKNNGITVNITKNSNNIMVDGENISPTDSTKNSLRPAQA